MRVRYHDMNNHGQRRQNALAVAFGKWAVLEKCLGNWANYAG